MAGSPASIEGNIAAAQLKYLGSESKSQSANNRIYLIGENGINAIWQRSENAGGEKKRQHGVSQPKALAASAKKSAGGNDMQAGVKQWRKARRT